jgi:hypothetical protein
VDGRTGGAYLRRVCDYVHLNPVRAGMLGNKERVHRFRWSSCTHYLTTKKKRPAWLRTDRLMGEHGLGSGGARSRREFSRRMESLRQEVNSPGGKKHFYNPKMSSKRKKEKEERESGMGSLSVEEILAAGGPPQKQKKEERKDR